uniref:Uncharacterized protein n=1 Tax=Anguilla anguilla TaxID=7936 RepID=A0A0E9XKN2_ANGAN
MRLQNMMFNSSTSYKTTFQKSQIKTFPTQKTNNLVHEKIHFHKHWKMAKHQLISNANV